MEKLNKIIEQLEGLKVSETLELIKTLEEKWGVSAAAAVAVAAGPVEAVEEQTEFEVFLKSMGDKMKSIKVLREFNPDMGLIDAKNAVESASSDKPYLVGKFDKSKSDEIIAKFKETGAEAIKK